MFLLLSTWHIRCVCKSVFLFLLEHNQAASIFFHIRRLSTQPLRAFLVIFVTSGNSPGKPDISMPALKLHSSSTIDIFSSLTESELELPFVSEGISAGFPSPALDFTDLSIDLNKHLVRHPASTFYGRVKGDSMLNAGISDKDLLVIDRSLEPSNGRIAVCYIDSEFTLKRIQLNKDGLWLMPENDKYKPIKIEADSNFMVWGIVTHVIKAF
ncbi:MAG: mutasis [Bacteroidota bacterium]